MSNKNLKIDFFVVGSQRCGTTWIDKALRSTGKVFLPENKQTYFFDRNYELGLDWYEKHFESNDGYKCVGEVATGYCLDGAVDLLAKHYPEAKIILAVREPVSRAYSNYVKRREDYQGLSFEEAMMSDSDLVERGLYGDMLDRLLKYYPLEQIEVVFFDDLESDPKRFFHQIADFLKIDGEVDERLFSQNVNSSLLEGVSKWAKKMKLYFVIKFLKKIGLTSIIRRIIYRLHQVKKQPDFIRSPKLIRIFSDSNKRLEEFSKRNMSAWIK